MLDPATEALRTLQTAITQAEVALAHRMHMQPRDLAALTRIAFAEAPVGPGDIARHVGVRAATATDLLDRLEAVGHVTRKPHAGDRRRTQLEVSESATAAVLEHLAPLFVELEELAQAFDEHEREIVLRYLEGASAAYARFAQEPAEPA